MRQTHFDRRSEPTAEQWRAVRLALERFTGIGQFACFGGCKDLPYFELRWDDPELEPRGAAGLTLTYADGSIVVALRSELSPERIHRTMLHELQHVADTRLPRLPTALLEERARDTSTRLAVMT